MSQVNRPSNASSNADMMKALSVPGYQEQPEISMLKVLDTYRRSVDYYNSYGLNSQPNSTRVSTERPLSGASFWSEQLRF